MPTWFSLFFFGSALATETWVTTASLQNQSLIIDAVALNSSSALVVGDTFYEIFDGNTWVQASLPILASFPQLVLLPNGNALCLSANRVTIMFDSLLGAWENAGEATVSRALFGTAVFGTKVIIVGGYVQNQNPLASCEIWDAGVFSPCSSLAVGRTSPTVNLLSNGKILVTGGAGASNTHLSSTELYDPSLGTWTLSGSMSTARSGHASALLLDQRILIVGGGRSLTDSASVATASAEIYDQEAGTFIPTGPLVNARGSFALKTLPSGLVIAAGGISDESAAVLNSEAYDPNRGTWSLLLPMNSFHYIPASIVFDGSMFVIGGSFSQDVEMLVSAPSSYQPTTQPGSRSPTLSTKSSPSHSPSTAPTPSTASIPSTAPTRFVSTTSPTLVPSISMGSHTPTITLFPTRSSPAVSHAAPVVSAWLLPNVAFMSILLAFLL